MSPEVMVMFIINMCGLFPGAIYSLSRTGDLLYGASGGNGLWPWRGNFAPHPLADAGRLPLDFGAVQAARQSDRPIVVAELHRVSRKPAALLDFRGRTD